MLVVKYFPFVMLLASGVSYANTVHVTPEPMSFNDGLPKVDALSSQESTPAQILRTLVFEDTIESAINRAVIAQDWQTLKVLLEDYVTLDGHDQTLYAYAKGAMSRQERHYDEAIRLYRGIVSNNPGLYYPRFDLGVMLFENMAYQEAKHHINSAYPHLGETMQALADRYLAIIDDSQTYKTSVVANIEKTDNVNHAARAKTVEFQGATWQKTQESLPQKATGMRYGVQISRDLNVAHNHFVYGELSGNGIYYWDNKDYSERSLKAMLGYKHRNAAQTLSVLPYVEQNWLAAKRYNRLYGASVSLHRKLDTSTQLRIGGSYVVKRFDNDHTANRHNSTQPSVNSMLIHALSPAWTVYGGVDASYENTRQAEHGSTRLGLSLGSINQLGEVGVRTTIRYVNRKFHAPSTSLVYFGQTRQDHEGTAQVVLWHNKIAYKGLMPQLNIRYQQVNSNQPSFYSKDSLGAFISLDRAF